MPKREVLAYAITHAPRGQKGGPYEAIGGDMGDTCERLSASLRWPVDNPVNTAEEVLEDAREFLAEEIAPKIPHARVIRIVRARPSEASAVEVLRELASYPGNGGDLARIQARARRVLAASGPDPSAVVRAAMRFVEHCTPALEGSAWFVATREFIDAVDAYRTLAALDDEYQAAVAATKGEGE